MRSHRSALDTARQLPTGRLSWLIWAVGAGVYLLAVFHRTSLGVAGPLAAERLDLDAARLGSFVMLQLGVYAAMQIPTGILVDRYGPRRILLIATVLMGAAQLLFGQLDGYLPALLARGLLGCGDAMTYVSVLRLVSGWFPGRRYPVMAALTGALGMAGNLLATVPLTALLQGPGWAFTFTLAGALSLAYALLLLRPSVPAPFRIRQPTRAAPSPTDRSDQGPGAGPIDVAPAPAQARGERPGRRVWREVTLAWRLPAGRLAFWVHLSTMACPTAFGVLWGFPYLTQALGYPPAQASSLLLVMVLGSLAAMLLIGPAVARRPVIRTPLAVLVSGLCLIAWVVLIAWPGGQPPLPVVVAAIVVLSVGGPASQVGFVLARDYNPRHRISTATGMVNVGGFTGAVVVTFAVGQILDVVEPGVEVHSAAAFRWALAAFAALTLVGIFRMLVWWLRTRAALLVSTARGETVPIRVIEHRWDSVDHDELVRLRAERGAETEDEDASPAAKPPTSGPVRSASDRPRG